MARLTTQEIEAIRKRAENATEGPWGVNTRDYPYDKASKLVTNNHVYIAKAFVGEADAEFIANAREDIPKLLAEVEHLTGVIGTLRSKLELISEANEYASGYLAREAIQYANEELR